MNIKVKWEFLKKSEIPKTLLEALGACGRDSFPNIHFLLVVGCTLLYQVQKQNDPSNSP